MATRNTADLGKLDAIMRVILKKATAEDPKRIINCMIVVEEGKLNELETAIKRVGGRVRRRLDMFHGLSAEIPAKELVALSNNVAVRRIEAIREHKAF